MFQIQILKVLLQKYLENMHLIVEFASNYFNGQNVKNLIKHQIIFEMLYFFVSFLRKNTIILKEICNFVGKFVKVW